MGDPHVCPQARVFHLDPPKPQIAADLESGGPREVLPLIVRWWPESVGFVEASVTPLFT